MNIAAISHAVGLVTVNVMEKLRRDFYTDSNTGKVRVHEFARDERALRKAIASYGFQCNERGWNFEPDFIQQELMKLLLEIRTAEADIQYLPVYLAGAIRRHIGQRAEELSARAKRIDHKVGALVKQVGQNCAVNVRVPTAVEVFAEVYRGIHKIQRERKRARQPAKDAQAQLL